MLWPWTSTARLRNSFHSTLHHLRHALGDPDWIVFRGGRYAFNRTRPHSYDVAEFHARHAAARELPDRPGADDEVVALLDEAMTIYRGDFVADLAGEEWIVERRDELRREYADAPLHLGTRQVRAGHLEAAAGVLRRLVEHDPLVESAHREQMKTCAALGDRGRALRQVPPAHRPAGRRVARRAVPGNGRAGRHPASRPPRRLRPPTALPQAPDTAAHPAPEDDRGLRQFDHPQTGDHK